MDIPFCMEAVGGGSYGCILKVQPNVPPTGVSEVGLPFCVAEDPTQPNGVAGTVLMIRRA